MSNLKVDRLKWKFHKMYSFVLKHRVTRRDTAPGAARPLSIIIVSKTRPMQHINFINADDFVGRPLYKERGLKVAAAPEAGVEIIWAASLQLV